MRRSDQVVTVTGDFVVFGPFRFDPETRELWRREAIVPLQARVGALLACLLQSPGRLRTKDQIIASVWPRRIVTDHSVVEAAARLRVALDDDARAPRYVETVPGRGYRFVGDASIAPASGPDNSVSRGVQSPAVALLIALIAANRSGPLDSPVGSGLK